MSRALLIVMLMTATSLANELVVVGSHDSKGRDAQGSYTGQLEVFSNATYRDVRRHVDTKGERVIEGRVKVVREGLLLSSSFGERFFERADQGKKVRWRWKGEGGEQTLEQRKGSRGDRSSAVRRLLQRPEGAARWLFENNLGKLDPNPDALILRSREPTPAGLIDLKQRYGLKTVISLNGDLDKSVKYGSREVNLRRFIAEQGLRHETFSLSASRAPTHDELQKIFWLLRDDSLKPILLHCRGGSDRTGVIGALYGIEFLGQSKEQAKATMREHMWAASGGTEIQGAVVDLYQPGHLRLLLNRFAAGKWF